MTGARVVVYRLGSLGDTVVCLPCLHKVAEVFADAERIVLTNFPVSSKAAPLQAVLEGSGLIHRFMAYPVGTRSFSALASLRSTLLQLDADTLVYLTPARGRMSALRDLIYFRSCGFKRIVGLPLSNDMQRNRRADDGSIEPECERLARCLGDLGSVALHDVRNWDLRLTAEERQAAASALGSASGRQRIAINMGCKVPENDWGEANWTALVAWMRRACADHALIFVGADEDRARADRVAAQWPGSVINLCGQVLPRVSAAALAGSRLFIGHDSGPLHLAACMTVPCVGLYGEKNEPRKWHPYGNGHHVIHEMKGVLAIPVERVIQGVRGMLQ